jgi:hypothetical protein
MAPQHAVALHIRALHSTFDHTLDATTRSLLQNRMCCAESSGWRQHPVTLTETDSATRTGELLPVAVRVAVYTSA